MIKVNFISKTAVIAALYVALTLGLAPFSYGIVQIRISEILVVLPFYNKKYSAAVILGTFIANLFSPMGVYDIIFGTSATALFLLFQRRFKTKRFIALIAAVVTGVIIGLELYFILDLPLILSMASVAAGEFIAVQVGVFVFTAVEKTNKQAINKIKDFI